MIGKSSKIPVLKVKSFLYVEAYQERASPPSPQLFLFKDQHGWNSVLGSSNEKFNLIYTGRLSYTFDQRYLSVIVKKDIVLDNEPPKFAGVKFIQFSIFFTSEK